MTDPETRIVTLAERPDLATEVPGVLASRWPAFMLSGRPDHDADVADLLTRAFPEHQVLMIADGSVVGAGLSLPVPWHGEAGPPAGWDDVIVQAASVAAGDLPAGVVSALSVTLRSSSSGRGRAAHLVEALKSAAAAIGPHGMFVPVRPVLKCRYPLIPFEAYLRWRTRTGEVFDPWLRLHLDLGGRPLHVAGESLTLRGAVADWERWTGLAMPGSGAYVIDGGLVPLEIDHERDTGTYREPNLWIRHP
jgi:hypothetical protein